MSHGGEVTSPILKRSPDFEQLLWNGEGDSFQLAVEALLPCAVRDQMWAENQECSTIRYEIEIGINRAENRIEIRDEALWLLKSPNGTARKYNTRPDSRATIMFDPEEGRLKLISRLLDGSVIFSSDGFEFRSGEILEYPDYHFEYGSQISALANMPADRRKFVAALWFRSLLLDKIQRFDLSSRDLEHPSPPGLGKRFQPDGSNLPWVIAELRKDPERFQQWLEHVRTALPDIQDIDSIERQEDRHRYLVIHYAGGATVPSWLASDGTLRLLALTVPAYLTDLDGVFLIEEPENGIHPQAIETVMQSLSSVYDGQVIIATHSPVALNMVDLKDVLCFAKDDTGATDIVAGNLHPALKNWKQGEPDFGVLFAAGILS
jgi:hypothetical protein